MSPYHWYYRLTNPPQSLPLRLKGPLKMLTLWVIREPAPKKVHKSLPRHPKPLFLCPAWDSEGHRKPTVKKGSLYRLASGSSSTAYASLSPPRKSAEGPLKRIFKSSLNPLRQSKSLTRHLITQCAVLVFQQRAPGGLDWHSHQAKDSSGSSDTEENPTENNMTFDEKSLIVWQFWKFLS